MRIWRVIVWNILIFKVVLFQFYSTSRLGFFKSFLATMCLFKKIFLLEGAGCFLFKSFLATICLFKKLFLLEGLENRNPYLYSSTTESAIMGNVVHNHILKLVHTAHYIENLLLCEKEMELGCNWLYYSAHLR